MGEVTAVFYPAATRLQTRAYLLERFVLRVEAVHAAAGCLKVHDIELLIKERVELV